jgi:hypothetical protein
MNMVRVAGTTVYPESAFWDACDELGILVWQDCMFAFTDPPDDDDFVEGVRHELTQNLGALGGRPSLALVCGNQEVEEIPAMMGLPRERWTFPFFEKTIPAIVDDLLPSIPYVTSNPTGGDLSFQMDTGVSQYFGVGGYLRTIADVRRDHVRFAAECLAFATPPERTTVDAVCGGATRAGHDPVWKLGVHHDAGRSWDMDDVRDYYVHALFAVDPLHERYIDPEHALDLGRAATIAWQNNGYAVDSIPRGDEWLRKKLNDYYEWAKTHNSLLIVTFDEHGGLFDHVPPPAAIPPDNMSGEGFHFDSFGVRVPALFISPRIAKRTILRSSNPSIPFDHTSLISTIAVADLLYQGQLITSATYRPLETYTTVALIYFAMLFPSTLLAQAYERRLARGR